MTDFQTGVIYEIALGNYSDRYMCIQAINISHVFKRVRTPKTKIDNVRLPQFVTIRVFGDPADTKQAEKEK